jgi:hypothetical protein
LPFGSFLKNSKNASTVDGLEKNSSSTSSNEIAFFGRVLCVS